MKVTVFGATGGIGGHIVRQALDRGYAVTAVVRDPARLDVRHPTLEVATVPALPAGTDTVALARFVVAVMQGMSGQARDGAGHAELSGVVRYAMCSWP